MFEILFTLLIILVFLILLFLIIPYHYKLAVNYNNKLLLNFSFSFLFLKLKLKVNPRNELLILKIFNFKKKFILADPSISNKSKSFIEKKSQEIIDYSLEEDNQIKKKLKFFLEILNKENISHIFNFFKSLFKELKADIFKVNLLFSFADPYYNGLFLAYYFTFKELTGCKNLKAEIYWEGVIFKAKAHLKGKIIPLKILFICLKFIFSFKTFKILRQYYNSK